VLATLQLLAYDAATCLETFQDKFKNISDNYTWSERDFRVPLEGTVAQTLWQIDKQKALLLN